MGVIDETPIDRFDLGPSADPFGGRRAPPWLSLMIARL